LTHNLLRPKSHCPSTLCPRCCFHQFEPLFLHHLTFHYFSNSVLFTVVSYLYWCITTPANGFPANKSCLITPLHNKKDSVKLLLMQVNISYTPVSKLPTTKIIPSLFLQHWSQLMGCRDCEVVRALASHQCGPGSIPRSGGICGLSLLVLFSAPRGFLRVLRFPLSPKN